MTQYLVLQQEEYLYAVEQLAKLTDPPTFFAQPKQLKKLDLGAARKIAKKLPLDYKTMKMWVFDHIRG